MKEIIGDEKYRLLAGKDYKPLQKQASLKTNPERLLSLEDARNYSKKLVRKWALEK